MDTDGSTVLRRIVLESDRQATSSSFLRATVYLDLHLPAVFRLPSAHQGKASAKRLFRSCSRSSLTSLTFQLWSFRNSAFSKRRRVVKVHHRHEHLIHQSVVFLETGYLSYQFGLTKSVASPGVWEEREALRDKSASRIFLASHVTSSLRFSSCRVRAPLVWAASLAMLVRGWVGPGRSWKDGRPFSDLLVVTETGRGMGFAQVQLT